MNKADMMEKARMKFRVRDEAHSKAIQEKLFSLGYKWNGENVARVYGINKPFLYAEAGVITFSGQDGEYFKISDATECVLQDGEIVPLPESGINVVFKLSPNSNDRISPEDISPKPVKVVSTGGSSSYYQLTITNKAGEMLNCELGDILRVLVNNDFDLSNIVKACRRASEASLGKGKEGATIEYDMNKVVYFAQEFKHWNKDK